MTRLLFPLAALLGVAGSLTCTGCASTDPGNERLERRLDDRNTSYHNRMDRREIRRGARDDRYDRWFEAM